MGSRVPGGEELAELLITIREAGSKTLWRIWSHCWIPHENRQVAHLFQPVESALQTRLLELAGSTFQAHSSPKAPKVRSLSRYLQYPPSSSTRSAPSAHHQNRSIEFVVQPEARAHRSQSCLPPSPRLSWPRSPRFRPPLTALTTTTTRHSRPPRTPSSASNGCRS